MMMGEILFSTRKYVYVCLHNMTFVYFLYYRTLMEAEVAHSVEPKSREPSPSSSIRSVQEDIMPVLLLCLMETILS